MKQGALSVEGLTKRFGDTVVLDGLGLSIAKFMVEKLGGRLGINSALGAGTEVTVTLPIRWTHREAPVH
mgnify:CR=1 FL=1